jgi:hypothetical protein
MAVGFLKLVSVRMQLVCKVVAQHPQGARADLIAGPSWKGQAPGRVAQFASRDNAMLVFGRVLMYSYSDVLTTYGLARQIRVETLSQE